MQLELSPLREDQAIQRGKSRLSDDYPDNTHNRSSGCYPANTSEIIRLSWKRIWGHSNWTRTVSESLNRIIASKKLLRQWRKTEKQRTPFFVWDHPFNAEPQPHTLPPLIYVGPPVERRLTNGTFIKNTVNWQNLQKMARSGAPWVGRFDIDVSKLHTDVKVKMLNTWVPLSLCRGVVFVCGYDGGKKRLICRWTNKQEEEKKRLLEYLLRWNECVKLTSRRCKPSLTSDWLCRGVFAGTFSSGCVVAAHGLKCLSSTTLSSVGKGSLERCPRDRVIYGPCSLPARSSCIYS